MSRTAEMFAKLPRALPRVMMHWDDAGADQGGHFVCRRCKHAAWYFGCSEKEFKRGIPCPNCNVFTPTEVAQILCDNSPRCDEHCTHKEQP
jgi:hypothetical protein